ncbi:hypothetical protein [Nocardia cyriacigeorgica]|uniref:hypothetical protein n=1 Tax=Nocardia cyriacigeorgica TaxID=135487 RepID=UPI0002E640F7|nr:hypothetical protein [Nocardia cyriacigeorgica]TLF57848.1 hypothetical protein FEK31_12570 [Nocardia cyriacigeorgica]
MRQHRNQLADRAPHRGARRRLAARGHRPLRLRHGNDLRELPPLPRRSRCEATGKIRYFDPETAELVLAGIDHTDPRRREQRTYHCSRCGGWHLTSQPPRNDPTPGTGPAPLP